MTSPSDRPPQDHVGLAVLSKEECDQLLGSHEVGRVAFVSDGDVVILPVTYRWHRGAVVFRTAGGAKLEAAGRHSPVAFEIDGWDEERASGWSVLVKGVAIEIDDEDAGDLAELGLRPWAPATHRRRWVRIRPDEVTGRRIV